MTTPGYTYGTHAVPRSPISTADFERIKATALFGDDDVASLRASLAVLEDQVEAILDVWYGFVGANPHLLASFTSKQDGAPLPDYLGGVRKRFARWILDTAAARYDQTWLDYQHLIALRHHRTQKNQADRADSSDIVPFRYLFPLILPITHTLRPFLASKGHTTEQVDQMQAAWLKSCLLQLTLWSYPYVKAGDF